MFVKTTRKHGQKRRLGWLRWHHYHLVRRVENLLDKNKGVLYNIYQHQCTSTCKVPLNNVQLDHLVTADAMLKPYFYGTVLWTITQPTDQERIPDRVDTDWRFGPIVKHVRGDGQLRLTIGVLQDNKTLARLVKTSMEICNLRWTVSAIDSQ